ncbi:unknown [Bacteroides stercoris CAG:120]|nr:unknown [Bacteroides stercoris CAG:120]
MVRLHRILYLKMLQQYSGSTRVFCQHQIRFLQYADSAKSHIFQISYWRRHYIKFSHIRYFFN